MAHQRDGHPEVVLRNSPEGTVLHKILDGTKVTIMERTEDLFAQPVITSDLHVYLPKVLGNKGDCLMTVDL